VLFFPDKTYLFSAFFGKQASCPEAYGPEGCWLFLTVFSGKTQIFFIKKCGGAGPQLRQAVKAYHYKRHFVKIIASATGDRHPALIFLRKTYGLVSV